MMETDVAAIRLTRLLAALLDHDTPPWRAGELPPLGHWLMFPPYTLQSMLGSDGHPARKDEGLPRRMWAGSRIRFLAPVPMDSIVQRETTTLNETDKFGKSGRMRFITQLHRLSILGTLMIEEEQDLVYREAPAANSSARLPEPENTPALPPLTRRMMSDPVALFRFSALTFNAHRIHYDRDYAVGTEGYPDLLVHGPYLATLLMDLYLRHRPCAFVHGFSFRALRPIFCGAPFTLGLTLDEHGGDLVAIDAEGGTALQGRAIA